MRLLQKSVLKGFTHLTRFVLHSLWTRCYKFNSKNFAMFNQFTVALEVSWVLSLICYFRI